MDWSMLSCSRNGHVTFAPDEPELRKEMGAALPDGTAWRCLRCGTFVAGEPSLSGPAESAPMIARGKEVRSKFILRLFAIERFVRVTLAAAAGGVLWRFVASRASIEATFNHDLPVIRDIFRDLGFNVSHSKLFGLLQHAFTLSDRTAMWLAVGATAYALLELAEGVGLWLARRWGEYLAMVATSLGLPLVIYDLTRKISVTALVLLALNIILVLYLVITKRLFGVRGGKAAYDARLRSESVLQAAERAAVGRRPGRATPAHAISSDPAHAAATSVAAVTREGNPEPR